MMEVVGVIKSESMSLKCRGYVQKWHAPVKGACIFSYLGLDSV